MICPIPRGFLVAVEGIDGSGKTTQAQRLARYCDEKRLTYILSKEPTSGKYGQLIRNSASRGRLSVEEELDRFYFSTAAYQGARGADPEIILSRNEAFAPQPDLLVILDVSPQTGLQRIREHGDEPNKFETSDSLERARAIFNQIDRPYKIGLNGEDLVDMIGSSIMYAFQRAAAEKIAKYDVSPSGVNRMRQLFGGTPILA